MSHDGGVQPHEHVPTLETRAKVMAFVCAGYTQEHIARYLRIHADTLRKHYPDELDKAQMDKIGELSNSAYKRAIEGNDKMTELVLRTQGRWANTKPPEENEKEMKQISLMEKLIDKL